MLIFGSMEPGNGGLSIKTRGGGVKNKLYLSGVVDKVNAPSQKIIHTTERFFTGDFSCFDNLTVSAFFWNGPMGEWY